MAVEPAGKETPDSGPPSNQREAGVTIKPRYRWPLVLIGIVLLGVLLAVMWMSYEIRRTQRIRDANAPTAQP